MLSNAYFLAKIRFDTAENEPAKNLQKFAKFANFADPNPQTRARTRTSILASVAGVGQSAYIKVKRRGEGTEMESLLPPEEVRDATAGCPERGLGLEG